MRPTAIGLVAIVITITVAWTALNASANTSGPDSSGYTWTDSNAPDPSITFDWIDITTTGTVIDNWDHNVDDGAFTQSLPFDFNFFGSTYDTVQITTNGFISFTIPGPEHMDENGFHCNHGYNEDKINPSPEEADLGNPIPHGDGNCRDEGWGLNPLIAAFFDDLYTSDDCGEVYYGTNGTAPNRTFIAQWDGVCHQLCT